MRRNLRIIPENHLLVFIILVFIFAYFPLRGSIFDNGIITSFDYPLHYYGVWFYEKYGWNYVQNLPFYKEAHGGYYKIFPTILIWGIKKTFSINLAFAFRIVVFLSFLLPPIAIFLLSERIGLSLPASFFSSLLWLASGHLFFLYGNFIDYIALSLCFFFLFFFVDYLKDKERNKLLTSVIILNLLMLTHPIYGGLFFIFLLILIWSTSRNLKKCFKELIKLLLLLFPALVIQSHFLFVFFTSIFSRVESPYYGNFNAITNITESFPDTLLIFLLGSAALMYVRRKYKEIYSMVICSLVLGFLLLFIVLFKDILNNMLPSLILYYLVRKPILFIRFLMVIPATYCFSRLLEDRRIITGSLAILSLSIFLILNFMLIYEFWENPNGSILFDKLYYNFKRAYSINFRKGVFSFSPNTEVMEFFDWLKNRDGRVLLEDVNDHRFGGYFMITIPIYTNKSINSFVGRRIPTIPPTEESTFFEKNMDEYSLAEFKEQLEKHRIKYIVMWSKDFLHFYLKPLNKNPDFTQGISGWNYNTKTIPDSYTKLNVNLDPSKSYIVNDFSGFLKVEGKNGVVNLHPLGKNLTPSAIYQELNLTKGKEYFVFFSVSNPRGECEISDAVFKVWLLTPSERKVKLWEGIVTYNVWNNTIVNITKYVTENGTYKFQLEGWAGGKNLRCSEFVGIDYFGIMQDICKFTEENNTFTDFILPEGGRIKYVNSFGKIKVYEYISQKD